MCELTFIGKASGQQLAMSSSVLRESKVTHRFLTAWGFGAPKPFVQGSAVL